MLPAHSLDTNRQRRVNLGTLRCHIQTVEPFKGLDDFIGIKTSSGQLSAKPVQPRASIALPIVFVNINQHFKHDANITQMYSCVTSLTTVLMSLSGCDQALK